MADEDAPVEDTPVDDVPVEGTPVEDAPVEDAPVKDAPAEEIPVEDAAAETGAQDGGSTSASKPRWRTARVAAVVAGAVLASAAAITGAVWAISAIVDDDDDYDDYEACCYEDYATAVAPEELRGTERDWGPRPDRDRSERAERRRGERLDRERGERFDRDRSKRAERDKRGPGKEREERYSSKEADGSEPDQADAAERCTTIHRFGSGENAVTILVCNAPGAEWPGFEPDGDGDYFEFRKRPRGFRFSPFFGPYGEWPFQDGWAFRDRTPFEDVVPFEDGAPFRNGMPFDLEELYERFFRNGLPFDSEGFEGFEDLFRDDERGFRFRGNGEEESQGNFCFRDGDEEQCFRDLGQLSDEEREQLERMMEMLDGFGLGDFLGGVLDSLDDLELEFPEAQTDPAGVPGA